MKQVLITLTLTAAVLVMTAQDADKSITSGTIVYEQTVKLDITLEGDASEFSSMLPKERKTKNILHFNEAASLYESLKEEKTDDMNDMASEGIMIKIEEPNYILFTDFEHNQQIEQREFMTREFLIESDLETKGWKLTGNQKTIYGYVCQEGLKEDDEKKIKAWFTPEISVSSGPGQFIGLPGMVLAVDIDNGQHIITATKITDKPIDKSILIKPKKGKKVSKEEFEAIVAEKMKEMGAESDGKGRHVIMEIKVNE